MWFVWDGSRLRITHTKEPRAAASSPPPAPILPRSVALAAAAVSEGPGVLGPLVVLVDRRASWSPGRPPGDAGRRPSCCPRAGAARRAARRARPSLRHAAGSSTRTPVVPSPPYAVAEARPGGSMATGGAAYGWAGSRSSGRQVVTVDRLVGVRHVLAAQQRERLRRSSGRTSTSRALEPSLGPTMPRDSSRSMRRPALAKPTRSLRWSIEVEPNCVVTTSSVACSSTSRSSPMSSSICFFGADDRDVLDVVGLELGR